MFHNINLTAATGLSGCGKTAMMTLMASMVKRGLGDPDKVHVNDMSDIISEVKRDNPVIASALKDSEQVQAAGDLVDDGPIIRLFEFWAERKLRTHPKIRYMFVAGLPRSVGQNKLVKHFGQHLVVHIEAKPDEVREAIMKRARDAAALGKAVRKDDAHLATSFERKMAAYEKSVLPAVRDPSLNVVNVTRSNGLAINCETVFEWCVRNRGTAPFSRHTSERHLRELSDKHHPVHRDIHNLLNPRIPAAFERQTATAQMAMA